MPLNSGCMLFYTLKRSTETTHERLKSWPKFTFLFSSQKILPELISKYFYWAVRETSVSHSNGTILHTIKVYWLKEYLGDIQQDRFLNVISNKFCYENKLSTFTSLHKKSVLKMFPKFFYKYY